MDKAAASATISALLARACDLYGPKGVLPGHGAEYEEIMAEVKRLEKIVG